MTDEERKVILDALEKARMTLTQNTIPQEHSLKNGDYTTALTQSIPNPRSLGGSHLKRGGAPQVLPTRNLPAGVCSRCMGFGTLTPRQYINYPMSDMSFCDCAVGQQVRAEAVVYYRAQSEKMQQELFGSAGVPSKFSAFTVDSWAAAMGRGAERTAAYAAAAAWQPQTEWPNSLYLYGAPGTGKTGLLTALFNRALPSCYGLWVEWYDFIAGVQGHYSSGDGGAQKAVEVAQKVPLLLLDDAGDSGRGVESDDKQRIMFQIINYRHNNGLPLLMSSNLTPLAFANQYGERTWRRVEEMGSVVLVERLLGKDSHERSW